MADSREKTLKNSIPSMAEQVALAAGAFQQQNTGHAPHSITAALSGDTLVITIQGALTPAERTLCSAPAGAAQVQEFHRQLFASSAHSLRDDIQRITGVAVRGAAAEIQQASGTLVQVLATGAMVQVFQLEGKISTQMWEASEPARPKPKMPYMDG